MQQKKKKEMKMKLNNETFIIETLRCVLRFKNCKLVKFYWLVLFFNAIN